MRHSILVLIIISACSNKDPFGNGADGNVNGDGGLSDGIAADAAPHHCVAAPTRVIVLGDSITACSVIGGPQAAACVSKQFSAFLVISSRSIPLRFFSRSYSKEAAAGV